MSRQEKQQAYPGAPPGDRRGTLEAFLKQVRVVANSRNVPKQMHSRSRKVATRRRRHGTRARPRFGYCRPPRRRIRCAGNNAGFLNPQPCNAPVHDRDRKRWSPTDACWPCSRYVSFTGSCEADVSAEERQQRQRRPTALVDRRNLPAYGGPVQVMAKAFLACGHAALIPQLRMPDGSR